MTPSADSRHSARLDRALAARGLARSRTEAAELIRAGQVAVNGRPAAKASQAVCPSDHVELLHSGPRYVSRAAHKLIGALEAFEGVQVAGRTALDAGACTGGFTQVLLERGAARVAAVDVGHGQLHETLRRDERVLVREGLNIRALERGDLMTGPLERGPGPEAGQDDGTVDLIVSDLSFISLRLVVAPLAGVARPGADVLLMVKPQFEVGRSRLPRTGVVTDPRHRREAVLDVLVAASDSGLVPQAVARSGLPGQDGNVEFFVHLRAGDPTQTSEAEAASWLDRHGLAWA